MIPLRANRLEGLHQRNIFRTYQPQHSQHLACEKSSAPDITVAIANDTILMPQPTKNAAKSEVLLKKYSPKKYLAKV